jgi:hypothetical protein
VIGCVPLHVPTLIVSTLPTRGLPEIVGGDVLFGAGVAIATITAVGTEEAKVLPAAFLASTLNLIVCATSADVRTYPFLLFAPGMFAQLPPFRSQRTQKSL